MPRATPHRIDSHAAEASATTRKASKKKAPYKDMERRREQNRVNAQKSYYRKLNILDTLRDEVAELESSYKSQMTALKPATTTAAAGADEFRPTQHVGPEPSEGRLGTKEDYRRQLQRLAAAHEELQGEHQLLQELQALHTKFQCRAQLLVDSEPHSQLALADHFSSQSEAQRASELADLRARCPAHMMRPLSVDECYGIGREVYAKILTFTENENYASTGGAVCGWADRRRVEDGLLKFSLQKMFPNHTTHEIATRTWPVLASPAKLESFYSKNMKMHCEIAQKVDDSNVVIYQEYEAKERDPVSGQETGTIVLVRSLLLITLFEIEDGYVMLFYGLDPSRLQERDEAEALAAVGISDRKIWLDKFSWCIWQEAGAADEHTSGAFVGAVPASGVSSRYWSVEVLLLSLRWEREVIGPSFILRSEDNPEPEQLDISANGFSSLLAGAEIELEASSPVTHYEQQFPVIHTTGEQFTSWPHCPA